jgi:hypothetical protein
MKSISQLEVMQLGFIISKVRALLINAVNKAENIKAGKRIQYEIIGARAYRASKSCLILLICALKTQK